jgi:hypothetical protein
MGCFGIAPVNGTKTAVVLSPYVILASKDPNLHMVTGINFTTTLLNQRSFATGTKK